MSIYDTLADTVHELNRDLDDPEWRKDEDTTTLARFEALRSDIRSLLEDRHSEVPTNRQVVAIRSSWIRWLTRAPDDDVLKLHQRLTEFLDNTDEPPPSITPSA